MAPNINIFDQFAMAALSGLLSNPCNERINQNDLVKWAYDIAEKMVQEKHNRIRRNNRGN